MMTNEVDDKFNSLFFGFVSTSSVLLTAYVGDLSLDYFRKVYIRAICDSATHGLIAGLSWIVVLVGQRKGVFRTKCILQILLCTLIAVFIDVDHFIEAGSLNLKDAISLNRRPFLHNTTIPISLCALSLALTWVLKNETISHFGFLVFVAFFSHHIRDSWRRGLWIAPFGKAIPVSYSMYLLVLAALPNIVTILSLWINHCLFTPQQMILLRVLEPI